MRVGNQFNTRRCQEPGGREDYFSLFPEFYQSASAVAALKDGAVL